MAAWSRKMLEKISILLPFLEKWPLTQENSQNFVPKSFIATPIDVLCSNFVTFAWREICKICVAYLTKKLPLSRIALKICWGQPQTMYSECSTFHPNWFTFGGVISERVNTIRVRSKMNPILGWSLALSRIIKTIIPMLTFTALLAQPLFTWWMQSVRL